jgi:hypothetical protein
MTIHSLLITAALLVTSQAASHEARQHPTMPPGMTHAEHLKQMAKDAELKKRGTGAMGFDQDAATHHFRLSATGGSIEVEAKSRQDAKTMAEIRSHLREIAKAFADGDFIKPLATHAEVPPGVPVMQAQKTAIAYRYEDTKRGGAVKIETSDAAALTAVHDFLRYQITEHKTGDPLSVKK